MNSDNLSVRFGRVSCRSEGTNRSALRGPQQEQSQEQEQQQGISVLLRHALSYLKGRKQPVLYGVQAGACGQLSEREDDSGSFLASPALAERPNNETAPPGPVGDDRSGGVFSIRTKVYK